MSAETDKYACLTYKHLFKEDPSNDVTSPEFKALVKKTEYDVLPHANRSAKQARRKDSAALIKGQYH